MGALKFLASGFLELRTSKRRSKTRMNCTVGPQPLNCGNFSLPSQYSNASAPALLGLPSFSEASNLCEPSVAYSQDATLRILAVFPIRPNTAI